MFYIKHTPRDRGFTLLEMVLVLFILLVIAGIAMPATAGLAAQERLKSGARTLQDYAASARRLAVSEGRSYEIILKGDGLVLERVPAGEATKEDVAASVKLPGSLRYTVRHWGKNAFSPPAGESWIFRPDGICEPIRVHFENGDGWIEYSFNPLTAGPRDDEYHFK